MNIELERRFFDLELETRAEGETGLPRIAGYAAVFNSLSQDLGGFREIILPGAFRDSLEQGADVVALFDHDPSKVLGRRSAKTLQTREDENGLRVLIDPPDTTVGRDVVESLKRGDLKQMSFGFRTVSDNFRMEKGEVIRELRKVDVFDVSIVTYPAYPDTSVGLRSLTSWQKANPQFCPEESLRFRLSLGPR